MIAGDNELLGDGVELLLPVEREVGDRPWQRAAACRGRERAGCFYPPGHHETREERANREQHAKAICRDCPVRQACLDYALSIREPFGIWGGLTEHERKPLVDATS